MSNKVYVPNKLEDSNLSVLNMITGISESKTLKKHLSCKCKYNFDGRSCNSNQWWNNDKCQWECKKRPVCEKDYARNPATCNCKNENYLASIMDDSVIMCGEIIEETVPTNFNENKANCLTQHFYILLAFSLITITLLIAIIIYCCLIKYRPQQKHSL